MGEAFFGWASGLFSTHSQLPNIPPVFLELLFSFFFNDTTAGRPL